MYDHVHVHHVFWATSEAQIPYGWTLKKPPVDIMGRGSWRFPGGRVASLADSFGFIQQRNTFFQNSESDV